MFTTTPNRAEAKVFTSRAAKIAHAVSFQDQDHDGDAVKRLIPLIVLTTLALGCAPKPYREVVGEYRVTEVKILSGEQSRVSDTDTYLIVATNGKVTIEAEGYDPVHVGETLCDAQNLLTKKIDPTKPCLAKADSMTKFNYSFDHFYKKTQERANR